MCTALTSNLHDRPAVHILLRVKAELMQFGDFADGQRHVRPETFVASFLETLETSTDVSKVSCPAANINDMLGAQTSDIALIEVLGRGRRTEAAAYTSTDAKWSLMVAATVTTSAHAAYAVGVAFRWDSNLAWQSCGTRLERTRPQHMRLVYVRDSTVRALDRDEVVNWCGGQTKASCATHPQYFLIREGVNSQALSCERRCPTPVRWRCPDGLPVLRHSPLLASGPCRHPW